MSYLAGHEADLFVSYGHVDNSPISAEEQRWIDRFHQDLEARVGQLLGSPVTVWRDLYLRGNHDFEAEILSKLQRSAVLIPIVSPRFIGSPWCQRELQAFINASQKNGGVDVGTSRRILKVVKTFVDIREQPEIIRQLLGYEFYRFDERGRPIELPDWDPEEGAHKRYLFRLDELAYEAQLLLKQMKAAETAGPQHVDAPATGKIVYLAETTRDAADVRDQLRHELVAHGYAVLPDEILPDDAAELRSAVARYLERCNLSVHIIGARYAKVPEGEDETRSVVWQQQDLALQRLREGNFDCVAWIAPGAEVTDVRQKQFLDWLEGQLAGGRLEFLRTPVDGLKNLVFDRLAPKAVKAPPPAENRSGRIYLICESEDYDAVNPIRHYLEDSGLAVDLPLWEGDPAEIRQDRESILQECDGVLIYHGQASEGWLRIKVREVRGGKALGRTSPFVPQAIYLGPEATQGKERFSDRDFIVMRNFGEFSPEALAPFLNAVPKAAGAPA